MNKAQKMVTALVSSRQTLTVLSVPALLLTDFRALSSDFLFKYNGELCSVADLRGEFPQYVWLQLCPSDREEREKTRLGDRAIAAAINGGVRLSDRGKSGEINNLLYCFSHNGLCIYITCYYVFCLYEVFLCVMRQERGVGPTYTFISLWQERHTIYCSAF